MRILRYKGKWYERRYQRIPMFKESSCGRPEEYDFLKILGRGSFGQVLLSRRKISKRLYAIKVVDKENGSIDIDQVMTERNVLKDNCNCPFLVKLHSSFQTEKYLFFVMDYVNGGDLFFHLIKNRRFNEKAVRFYSAEIACAIGYLHSNGVVHRDLKPENLLLDIEGHIKVTDFGACKVGVKSNSISSNLIGTLVYAAPEMLVNEPYGTGVDWWSLGVLVFEMVTGQLPFGIPNDKLEDYDVVTDAVFNNPIIFPADIRVSIGLSDFVKEMLELHPTRRLGFQPQAFLTIQRHKFYRQLNWNNVLARKLMPPICPALSMRNVEDVSNFEKTYTEQTIRASNLGQSLSHGQIPTEVCSKKDFPGFAYLSLEMTLSG